MLHATSETRNPGWMPSIDGRMIDQIGLTAGVVLAVASIVVIIAFIIVDQRFDFISVVLVFVIAFILWVITLFTAITIKDAGADEERAAYAASVSEWLEDDYGISVSGGELRTLVGRETVTVSHNGVTVAVQLIDGPRGTIEVQTLTGQMLNPRD